MEKVIKLSDKTFVPYIPNARIEQAIDRVAERINSDYAGTLKCPVILCVLEGSLMFTAELLKRLDFPCELMSVKASSYRGTQSTGAVELSLNLSGRIAGREVIVVEDIVDTGNTISAIRPRLLEQGASAVKICTLFFKPESYSRDIPLDYVAMEIENRFIVGFGLDYNQIGRNLKDLYQISE